MNKHKAHNETNRNLKGAISCPNFPFRLIYRENTISNAGGRDQGAGVRKRMLLSHLWEREFYARGLRNIAVMNLWTAVQRHQIWPVLFPTRAGHHGLHYAKPVLLPVGAFDPDTI